MAKAADFCTLSSHFFFFHFLPPGIFCSSPQNSSGQDNKCEILPWLRAIKSIPTLNQQVLFVVFFYY